MQGMKMQVTNQDVCDAILYRVVGEVLSKVLRKQNSTESEEGNHVDTWNKGVLGRIKCLVLQEITKPGRGFEVPGCGGPEVS